MQELTLWAALTEKSGKRLKEITDKANALGAIGPAGTTKEEVDRVKGELLAAVAEHQANTERLARATDEAARQLEDGEEETRQFWFRRFHTSLAIAHGAAFAALGSNLFDKDTPAAVIAGAWHPMALFAAGMVIAGVLPMALYAKKEPLAWKLAGASAAFFLAGLGACLIAMWLRAEMVWPWQA